MNPESYLQLVARSKLEKLQAKLSRTFFSAILEGRTEDVAAALQKYPTIREARAAPGGATPLIIAAGAGNCGIVEQLLEAGASLDETDDTGATPLIMAAFMGRRDVIQLILSSEDAERRGRSRLLEATTSGGETALMAASKKGYVSSIRALLQAGADVSAVSEEGLTPLAFAAGSLWAPAVQELLAAGADPCQPCGPDRVLPVMLAAAHGSEAAVQALLGAAGPRDSNAGDLDGPRLPRASPGGGGASTSGPPAVGPQEPPAAAAQGPPGAREAVGAQTGGHKEGGPAAAGASLPAPVAINPEGSAKGPEAAIGGDRGAPRAPKTEAVGHQTVFYEAGYASESPASGKPQTASTSSSRSGSPVAGPMSTEEVLQIRDARGMTVFLHACSGGQLSVARLLLEKGADPNVRDYAGRGSVYLAAQSGKVELLRWLLGPSNAAIEDATLRRSTPLFAAVVRGHLEVIEELLNRGARLEARDWKGRTPLAKAASRGMTQVCKFLIAKDADLTAADAEGHVPRNLAAKHGHHETAEMLSRAAREAFMAPNWQEN